MKDEYRHSLLVALCVGLLGGCAAGTKNQPPPPVEPPQAAPTPESAPAPAQAPAPAAATPEPPAFVIEDVHFAFDRSNLRPQARRILDGVAEALKAQPDVRYELGGHTDWIGTDTYNQGLSERRASSVRTYLLDKGVPAGQLVTRAYGESRPISSNETDAGRAENRRVEIKPLNR